MTQDAARACAAFPATPLASQADFVEFRRATQDRLDARYLHETAALTADDVQKRQGTCGLCLRRTIFTTRIAGWGRDPDGKLVPDWAEALHCDCEDRLGCRSRAVVHFAQRHAGLRQWSRLLLFGPPRPAHRRLTALAGEAVAVPALLAGEAADAWHLPTADNSVHLAVAIECLHHIPPLDTALVALCRVLAPGGSLVFTVPFRYDAARSVARADIKPVGGRLPAAMREQVHDIGWDIFARLRQAGFTDTAAHCYWSGELGYLGAFNMIFHAAR